MLKLLRAAILNHGGHRLERAILRLRKPAQIPTRDRRIVAPAGAEEMPMTVEEGRELRDDRLHQRYG